MLFFHDVLSTGATLPLASSTLLYGMLGVHRAAAAGAGQERAGAGGGHLPLPLLLLMRNHHSAGEPWGRV